MIATLLLARVLWGARQQQSDQQYSGAGKLVILPMRANSPTILGYKIYFDPQYPPKDSPKVFGEDKKHWQFEYVATGFVEQPSGPTLNLFRVFNQEQKPDRTSQVTRMLLRLWDFNFKKLGFLHPLNYNKGVIDVYLCFGGKAGGEQLFGVELYRDKPDIKVNTIYIYDMSSFTDPVEMAREIAHEYGHATLPHVGGFESPEEWADGYLGEKVSLRWMRDALVKGELTPDDTMGATADGLSAWISKHVDPLVFRAAQTFPSQAVMGDKSAKGMDAFIGLALYIDTLYSDVIFRRSMMMIGSVSAADYPDSVILAAEEPAQVTLRIPSELIGKQIWIPLGSGQLSGTNIIKKKSNGWVQILATKGPIVILNTH